jgi:hypothetical protein
MMDVKTLKELAGDAIQAGQKFRVHGNGFLQLDLDDRRRLHVWADQRIPRQRVSHPIHDHVFGFESDVVVGRLVNVTYVKFHPALLRSGHARYFRAYQAQPTKGKGHDTLLAPLEDGDWFMEQRRTDVVQVGMSYRIDAFEFHETLVTEPTVSVITKDGDTLVQNPEGRRPTVMVPNGREPDNEFKRSVSAQAKMAKVFLDVLKGEGQW